MIKLNSDDSIKNEVATVAVAARDQFGEVCGSFVFRNQIDLRAATEVFTNLEATQLALKKGWRCLFWM